MSNTEKASVIYFELGGEFYSAVPGEGCGGCAFDGNTDPVLIDLCARSPACDEADRYDGLGVIFKKGLQFLPEARRSHRVGRT